MRVLATFGFRTDDTDYIRLEYTYILQWSYATVCTPTPAQLPCRAAAAAAMLLYKFSQA